MSIRSTSLEPKSQLTISLALKRKQKGGGEKEKKRKGKKERKFPIKRIERKQKRKENSQSRIETKQKKYTEKSLDQTTSKQIQSYHQSKYGKKGNHDLKWSSPFDYQPKSRASVTCSPRAKQKQKRKRPKNTQSQIVHQEKPHSQEKVLLIHDHTINL